MSARAPRNEDVADALERVADLLEAQDESPYRVRAWRAGARSVRSQAEPVAALLAREGREGLDRLPSIGKSLAGAIAELVHTGRLRMLDRLEGEISPEDLFSLVADTPAKSAALFETFLEIGRTYGVQVEHMLFAALRSYQQLRHNYFQEMEEAAAAFRAAEGWGKAEVPTAATFARFSSFPA